MVHSLEIIKRVNDEACSRPYPDGIAWDEALRQRERANKLEKLIERLKQTGSKGVTIAWSNGHDKKYEVITKFNTLSDMQEFYSSLIELGK